MNLQFLTLGAIENLIIQVVSFQISWFIYKKMTDSQIEYWKIILLNLLGVALSFLNLDRFYFQIIVFLGLALHERIHHRITFLGSFFFGVYPVIFTDLFSRFTPVYVFNNLLSTVTLADIQGNFILTLLSYLMIYPAFLYINHLSRLDLYSLKDLFYTRGRERLLIIVDGLFLTYIVCLFFLTYVGKDSNLVSFIAMAIYLLMVITLNRYSHELKQARNRETIETYIDNLELYNKHVENLFNKVKPLQQEFEKLLVNLEVPLSQNHLEEVLSVYYNHLEHLNLENLELSDKLSVFFEIPYVELRTWLVNQIIVLEQKGIPIDLSLAIEHYPEQLKTTELIHVLGRCLDLAEYLWQKEPETSIVIELSQEDRDQLTVTIGNTNEEAEPQLDPALTISRQLAHFCWSHDIKLTNKKELFKTYQVVTIMV